MDYTLDPNDDYDIAHINTIGLASWKVLKNAKKKKKPVVYHTHTTSEDFRGSIKFSNQLSCIIRLWAKKLYSSADYLISPTNYTKNLISSKYVTDKEIRVISNGVDTKLFSKDKELGQKFREKFGYSNKDIVIMSAGLPFQRKGVLDIIEIAKQNPEYKFIWFGASSIKNILPKKVKNIIENPPENVIFPGFVDEEILLGAYSSANLFFFPTYEENEGIVVLEALSMKLPALLRDIPVYSDWLKDKKTCFKGSNNAEFKEYIEYIVNNNTSDVTENAYELAEERELSRIGMKYKEYYDYILSKGQN